MRRVLLVAVTVAGLLGAVAAQARTATSLPALFAHEIQSIAADARAPAVLLPPSLPLASRPQYPEGGPMGTGYDLSIGAVPNCGDATVCFVADFSATRATTVFGRRVTVRGAVRAGYVRSRCGASCAPPQVDFVVHGVRYDIQANVAGTNDRRTLIDAAQAAISAGPR